MKDFEFVFDGKVNGDKSVRCGIKLLSGSPVDVALSLGTYASENMKLGNPEAAIIVINAFKKFIELNRDQADYIMSQMHSDDVGSYSRLIMKPGNFKLKKS